MAITFDNIASQYKNSGARKVTISQTRAFNSNYVVAGLSGYGSFSGGGGVPVDPIATYGGNSMTKIVSTYSALSLGSYSAIYVIYGASLPTSGTQNCVVDFDPSFTSWGGWVASYIGCDETNPAVTAFSSGSGTSISTNITTVSNNSFIVDVVAASNVVSSITQNVSQTSRINSGNTTMKHGGSDKAVASPSLNTMSWSFGSSATHATHCLIALRDAIIADTENTIFFGTNF
jgi:hypothetical protein